MAISSWMSWEGSVDLVALSQPNLEEPDIIVHCSRMVHTPVGSAPAGMILLPDLDTPGPRLIGFVSTNPVVSAYFGPHLFAGTPFELAPALQGEIEHETYLPEKVRATMRVMDFVIELELSDLGELVAADRGSGRLPFCDRSLEAPATTVHLLINGQEQTLFLPPQSLNGGPPSVWSPCGIYAR
ncbi:MAG: hypothetical protein HC934_08655 [Acaryochloridaceae cyanobacterium SU_2_1]|nr:hypothetical protein [Acaryochloridaceae cyanobacterium SU_2_1]